LKRVAAQSALCPNQLRPNLPARPLINALSTVESSVDGGYPMSM
jgi:hypothetical protein